MLCDYLCLLMGNFIPFIFNVITDIVRCKSSILLFVFYLSHMFYIPFSIFSCLVLDKSNVFIVTFPISYWFCVSVLFFQ